MQLRVEQMEDRECSKNVDMSMRFENGHLETLPHIRHFPKFYGKKTGVVNMKK